MDDSIVLACVSTEAGVVTAVDSAAIKEAYSVPSYPYSWRPGTVSIFLPLHTFTRARRVGECVGGNKQCCTRVVRLSISIRRRTTKNYEESRGIIETHPWTQRRNACTYTQHSGETRPQISQAHDFLLFSMLYPCTDFFVDCLYSTT